MAGSNAAMAAGDSGAESVAVPPYVRRRVARPAIRATVARRPAGDGGERPKHIGAPSWADRPQVFAAEGTRRKRVALLSGCVQQVLRPEINEATIRLLTRHGCEVVIASGGCRRSLSPARPRGARQGRRQGEHRRVVAGDRRGRASTRSSSMPLGVAWRLRNTRHLLRDDPEGGTRRPRFLDVPLCLRDTGRCWLRAGGGRDRTGGDLSSRLHDAARRLAAHAGKGLLAVRAGFVVREPAEAHLLRLGRPLLGPSAGNSDKLRRRKLAHIEATQPQIDRPQAISPASPTSPQRDLPVVHMAELLDWTTAAQARRAGLTRPGAIAGATLTRLVAPLP